MVGGLLGIFFLSSFASLGAVSSLMDHNSPKLEEKRQLNQVYDPFNMQLYRQIFNSSSNEIQYFHNQISFDKDKFVYLMNNEFPINRLDSSANASVQIVISPHNDNYLFEKFIKGYNQSDFNYADYSSIRGLCISYYYNTGNIIITDEGYNSNGVLEPFYSNYLTLYSYNASSNKVIINEFDDYIIKSAYVSNSLGTNHVYFDYVNHNGVRLVNGLLYNFNTWYVPSSSSYNSDIQTYSWVDFVAQILPFRYSSFDLLSTFNANYRWSLNTFFTTTLLGTTTYDLVKTPEHIYINGSFYSSIKVVISKVSSIATKVFNPLDGTIASSSNLYYEDKWVVSSIYALYSTQDLILYSAPIEILDGESTFVIREYNKSPYIDKIYVMSQDFSVNEDINGQSLNIYTYFLGSNMVIDDDGYDGSIYDGLTLIGHAFNNLSSLLYITILPHITIGTLVFLPVVAGIIVIIFKMISK